MDLSELGCVLALPNLSQDLTRVEAVMTDLVLSGHPSLAGPSLRIIRAPGKRLRPALTLAAAACGGRTPPDEAVFAAGAAVELAHNGSLVHDDLMDRGGSRRGVESVSSREGPYIALLCGDYLLALSGYAAARASQEVGAEVTKAIVALCNGQVQELNDNFNPLRSEESIMKAIEGKTAALIRTSCYVGGLCAGLSSSALSALGAYGHAFGMSFQILDDVLDFISSQALFGKPVLNDLRMGVYTLPVAFARVGAGGSELVEALRLRDGHTATEAYAEGKELCLGDAQVDAAVAILRSGDGFRRALDLALAYAAEAADAISALAGNATAQGLAQLPRLYIEDQLSRKVADEAMSSKVMRWLMAGQHSRY